MTEELKTPTQEELAYFAGFFDGEGCVGIYIKKRKQWKHPHHRLDVYITNTHPGPLRKLMSLFGGEIHVHVKQQPHHKTAWRWNLQSRKAEEFLQQILPFLIVKKDEALLALEFRKTQIREKKSYWITDDVLLIRDQYQKDISALKQRTYTM
jgi:hypothetical protein